MKESPRSFVITFISNEMIKSVLKKKEVFTLLERARIIERARA